MIINFFGQACFRLQGDKSTLVTDPLDESCGLKIPRLSADIVTISNNQKEHNVKGLVDQPPFTIDQPCEYEIKNTFVYGIAGNQKVIYRIEMDGITLVHLGEINAPLSNGEMEKLEGVDILMIPVGGEKTLNAKQATELISQLEPRIVIPMYYQLPGLKIKLDGLDKFCKEIGASASEKTNKFKITKKDLPQEDIKVVILEP